MQVIEVQGQTATCRGRQGLQAIDVLLVAPVAAGDWLLTWLGAARGRLEAAEAAQIDRALDALDAVARGERIDVAAFFPDLVGREPVLPDHLRGPT